MMNGTDIEAIGNVYHFLGTKDRHLVRLFHWIRTIENLSCEVRQSEMDDELFDELQKINNRLIHEVGIRMVAIMPCGDDA